MRLLYKYGACILLFTAHPRMMLIHTPSLLASVALTQACLNNIHIFINIQVRWTTEPVNLYNYAFGMIYEQVQAMSG